MDQLRSLHAYTHKFCREDRKKVIDVNSAVAMLQLLHGSTYPKHIPNMCEFLQEHETAKKRGVSSDEWSMILNFCTEIAPDCSNYQVRHIAGARHAAQGAQASIPVLRLASCPAHH